MELPMKQHQLLSHWVPGLVVLMFLVLMHYGWSYTLFTNFISEQGSVVATISIILLAVSAFLIGEFIDAIRDLSEPLWDKYPRYKIFWKELMSEDAGMQVVRDMVWTYYVLCYNTSIAMLLCVIIYGLNFLMSYLCGPFMVLIWIIIAIGIVVVFLLDAKSLREELSEITRDKYDKNNKDKDVDNE